MSTHVTRNKLTLALRLLSSRFARFCAACWDALKVPAIWPTSTISIRIYLYFYLIFFLSSPFSWLYKYSISSFHQLLGRFSRSRHCQEFRSSRRPADSGRHIASDPIQNGRNKRRSKDGIIPIREIDWEEAVYDASVLPALHATTPLFDS